MIVIEPNDESGANIEASKMWRTDREKFNKIVKKQILESFSL